MYSWVLPDLGSTRLCRRYSGGSESYHNVEVWAIPPAVSVLREPKFAGRENHEHMELGGTWYSYFSGRMKQVLACMPELPMAVNERWKIGIEENETWRSSPSLNEISLDTMGSDSVPWSQYAS